MSLTSVTGGMRQSLRNIAELRELEPAFDLQQSDVGCHTVAGIGGGVFYADFSDTTTVDDNGITIVTAGGKRWKRKIDVSINPFYFGAVGDGVVDDHLALQAMLNAAVFYSVYIPARTFRTTGSLHSPHNTAEYGLSITGATTGRSIILFDGITGDGFYLSHRPSDPVNYDKPSEYEAATIQRNINIKNLTFQHLQGSSAAEGTRTGSGLHLYFTSMVSLENVICKGWKRGFDGFLWVSTLKQVRCRECDVGFYLWTGTTVSFISTYAGSCQTGYLIGGDKGTSAASNTNTAGIQNPYPPSRPVGITFTATAADATTTYAYVINDCYTVTFDTVSAEGTTEGMFYFYKTNGRIRIENPAHAENYGASYTSANYFIYLGNGYCNVHLVDCHIDGVYNNAIIGTNATGTYYSGSSVQIENFIDFSTGSGAGKFECHTKTIGSKALSSGKTGTIEFSVSKFLYGTATKSRSVYNSMRLSVCGTARCQSAGTLLSITGDILIGGDFTGTKTIKTNNFATSPVYGLATVAFAATPSIDSSGNVTVTLSGNLTGPTAISWDSTYTNFEIVNIDKFEI